MFESVDAHTDGRTPARVPSYKLTFGSGELLKSCSSKTHFISSAFRLLCIALWHYVREHIHGQETKSVTAIICVYVKGKFDSSD